MYRERRENGHTWAVGRSTKPHPHSPFTVWMESNLHQCLHGLVTHVTVPQSTKEVGDEGEDVRHRETELDPANEALHGLNKGEGRGGEGGRERKKEGGGGRGKKREGEGGGRGKKRGEERGGERRGGGRGGKGEGRGVRRGGEGRGGEGEGEEGRGRGEVEGSNR